MIILIQIILKSVSIEFFITVIYKVVMFIFLEYLKECFLFYYFQSYISIQ